MLKIVMGKFKKKFTEYKKYSTNLIEKYYILSFLRGVVDRIKEDKVSRLSAQITYYLLMALFPLMIFLLNLLKFFNIEQETILTAIDRLIPEQSSQLVFSIINEVITDSGVTLLSLGMITTLWSASRGANAIIEGLNKAYDVKEERSFFLVKAVGLLATLGIPIMILISFLFLVLGEQIGQFLSSKLGLSDYLGIWEVLRLIIPLSAMTVYFIFLYKLAPNRDIKVKQALIGAIFSTFGWISVSMIFSFYVSQFGNYSKVYGGLGSIIVLLLWLNLSSMILVIGGEINAEYIKPHRQRNENIKED